jgi:hypothetical protein
MGCAETWDEGVLGRRWEGTKNIGLVALKDKDFWPCITSSIIIIAELHERKTARKSSSWRLPASF